MNWLLFFVRFKHLTLRYKVHALKLQLTLATARALRPLSGRRMKHDNGEEDAGSTTDADSALRLERKRQKETCGGPALEVLLTHES